MEHSFLTEFEAKTASLVLDHLEVARQQSVAGDGTVGGNSSEGTDCAQSNEREVETILGVPFQGWLGCECQYLENEWIRE